ncbi:hypothetical protein AJ88_30660 [Mesorhizobium amorphae CCBAU 01583]|nr:hypothetical protein AJ88_30660 [Mesorhizobium amorphae CCBAU 01583]
MNYGTFRTDPYSLERVEVIKGPVSVLYGAGTPAGIINKVSKLPTEEKIREVELLYGTQDRAQAAFDFSGPVQEGSNDFLYRVVGLDGTAKPISTSPTTAISFSLRLLGLRMPPRRLRSMGWCRLTRPTPT